MAIEQSLLSEFEKLSTRERLLKLAELGRKFEGAQRGTNFSNEEKTEYATALTAVQHAMVETNQKKPLSESQKIRFAAVISKSLANLSEHNIRLPIPGQIQTLEVNSLSGFISHLEQAKKVIDIVKKEQKTITQEQKDSVVSVILSFQHFLCKVYQRKEPLSAAQETSISNALQTLAILVPELAAIGIKIPVPVLKNTKEPPLQVSTQPELQTSDQPENKTKIIDSAKEIGAKLLQEAREMGREQYQRIKAELSKIAEEISAYLKETVGKKLEGFSFKDVVSRGLNRFKERQNKKREAELQRRKEVRKKRRKENEEKKKSLKPGDILLTYDVQEKLLTREVIISVSQKSLETRLQYSNRNQSGPAAFRTRDLDWFNNNIESIEIQQHIVEVIGANNNIGLSESLQTYESEIGLVAAAACDKGINYKNHNEDRVVAVPNAGFFVVIDGVGGQGSGDKAAEILAKSFATNQNVAEATKDASNKMAREVQEQSLDERSGAAFVSAKLHRTDASMELEYHYAGDCSLMVFHADGRISVGKVDSWTDRFQVPEDEALYHPKRNVILNSVDAKQPKIKSDRITVNQADRVILASDGISDNLTPEEIRQLTKNLSPQQAIKKLDQITSQRMQNWYQNNPSFDRDNVPTNPQALAYRKQHGVFPDGYRSAAKTDNRSIVVFDIK